MQKTMTDKGAEKKQPKVLIIEDDQDLAWALEMYLKGAGFSVQAARNGEVGIDKAKTFHPDMVLLDLAMPAPNGFEVGRRLREDPTTRDIPVMAMTALYESDVRQTLSDIGINQMVSKPFSFSEMADRLHRSLRHPSV
jgi:DNA-binding response OmpR family regulator